jgi:O-Antigen ligase
MVPSLFALIVPLAGAFATHTRTLQLQMLFCLFGGAAALTLTAMGGAIITPAVLFLPFLLYRGLVGKRLQTSRVPPAGFWLGLAVGWGVLGAIILPRVLAETTRIMIVDRESVEQIPELVWLRPVSGNITQAGYAVGNVLTFFAVRALLVRKDRFDRLRDAVLLLGALNCAAAIINLGEYHLGLPPILEYVRTGYKVYGTYEAAGTGLVRIHGTFPETSMFSAFTLPLFAFTFSLWLSGVRPTYSGTVAGISLVFLLISTSGTAYVGLAAYLGCMGLMVWRRSQNTSKHLSKLFMIGLLALTALVAAFVFEFEGIKRVEQVFDAAVMKKMESDSGSARSLWNKQAWQNFLDSYGLGIGLGSARASSFPLVLLSNLGAIGTFAYVAFVKNVIAGPSADPAIEPMQRAARQAVLAALITASVSGIVFELGVAFYVFAAIATVRSVEGSEPIPEAAQHIFAATARLRQQ